MQQCESCNTIAKVTAFPMLSGHSLRLCRECWETTLLDSSGLQETGEFCAEVYIPREVYLAYRQDMSQEDSN